MHAAIPCEFCEADKRPFLVGTYESEAMLQLRRKLARLMTRPRSGKAAVTALISARFFSLMSPLPLVVRASSASWRQTSSPSFVVRTSVSPTLAPTSIARR